MSDAKQAPRLPDVVDEAGATPRWVPLLGIALLIAAVLLVGVRQVMRAGAGGEPAPVQNEAGE
jgi:hypothetical protein